MEELGQTSKANLVVDFKECEEASLQIGTKSHDSHVILWQWLDWEECREKSLKRLRGKGNTAKSPVFPRVCCSLPTSVLFLEL